MKAGKTTKKPRKYNDIRKEREEKAPNLFGYYCDLSCMGDSEHNVLSPTDKVVTKDNKGHKGKDGEVSSLRRS